MNRRPPSSDILGSVAEEFTEDLDNCLLCFAVALPVLRNKRLKAIETAWSAKLSQGEMRDLVH